MERPPRKRSYESTLSWQLGNVVNALRATVPAGLVPGKATIALINELRRQITEDDPHGLGMKGPAVDAVPKLTEDLDSVDILVIAEALYALIQSALSPDELEMLNKGYPGFTPPSRS